MKSGSVILRFLQMALILAILYPLLGCALSPGARRPTVVNVAAVIFPGGAPPAVLSLYKAALEISKANSGDFELKITTLSPTMEPGAGPTNGSPIITALEQALAQDPPPDVVLFSSSYEFAEALSKELLQPLDPYLRSERALKTEDYFPGALEAVIAEGQICGLPLSVGVTLLQYDKRLFDAAGLEPPGGNWTWSTLLEASRVLTKVTGDSQSDQYALNLLGPLVLPSLIWQNGGDIISKDGKRSLLAEPPAVEAIKFYYDLLHTYKVSPPPPSPQGGPTPGKPVVIAREIRPGEVPPLFVPGGRVAMQFLNGYGMYIGASPWMMGQGGERPIRVSELPRGKMQATQLEVGNVIALTNRAANGRQAYRAMVALVNEMQKELTVPAQRAAAKNLRRMSPNLAEEDVQVILNSLEYARALPLAHQDKIIRVLYEKLVQPIQQGTKPPAEIAREAAEAMDEVLNQ